MVTEASEQLQAELHEVSQQLESAVAELYPPLDYLARSQLVQLRPLVRAAIALTAGIDSEDTPHLRTQRLMLAAALEMLHMALRIHRLLLAGPMTTDADRNQRSLTGSVILTGDYCFTRSAILAAQTDSVEVVAIFSRALKQISEEILRDLFATNEGTATVPTADENLILFQAGIEGAAHLANLPPESVAAMQSFATHLATALRTASPLPAALPRMPTLTPTQISRWQALHQWLHAEGHRA